MNCLESNPSLQETFQNAVQAHHTGQLEVAEQGYRTVLSSTPQHPVANHNLGVILLARMQASAALPYLRQALQGEPTIGQYWLSYVEGLIAAGQRTEASAVLTKGKAHGLTGEAVVILEQRLAAVESQGIPSDQKPNPKHNKRRQAQRKRDRASRTHGQPTAADLHTIGMLYSAGRYTELEKRAHTVTRRYPAHPLGWKGLAAAWRGLGRFAEATTALEKVCALAPEDAESLSNLGGLLHRLGRLEDAENALRRALLQQPERPDALGNLGLVLKTQGHYEAAEAHLRRALELKPDYFEALSNLGVLLKDRLQHEQAETLLRRALALKPDSVEVLNNLGELLRRDGRIAAGEACLQRALDIDPDFVPAVVGLGLLQVDQGRFEEALAQFERARQLDPNNPYACAAVTTARKMTETDRPWLARAEALLERTLNIHEESQLRYAMGKCCDELKEFEQAFTHYQRANNLQKTFYPGFSRDSMTHAVDVTIRYHTTDFLHTRWPGSSASLRPVFVVGMPRSGTSLVEQIMASLPVACGAGELRYWARQFNTYKREVLSVHLSEALIRSLAQGCLNNLEEYASGETTRVVDKMPGNFMYLGLIHAVFPHARILHTQRNPIDTCLSIYFQNFNTGHNYGNDLEDLAHYYRQYHRLMAHWRTVLPPEVFLDVPYEALVEDQEGWSRRIIDFIGLEWDDRCLNFHQTERKVGTASNWQVRQPVYKTSRERWRNYEPFVGPLLPLLELAP